MQSATHFGSDWGGQLESLEREDPEEDEGDEDSPVFAHAADETSDGYFDTFDPPPRDSASSTPIYFTDGMGRADRGFGARGSPLTSERLSAFEDRPFSIRVAESKELTEQQRHLSPLVPMPSRIVARQTQSFNLPDEGPLEREKMGGDLPSWRRSTSNTIEALRRKDEVVIGARSSPIGTPVSATRRFTDRSTGSGRGSSPAAQGLPVQELQAAADSYIKSLTDQVEAAGISPAHSPRHSHSSVFSGTDATWHFTQGDAPLSPQLPRSSRHLVTASPRVPGGTPKLSLQALDLPKSPRTPFDNPRSLPDPNTLQPNASPFQRVRLTTASGRSPITTPRSVAGGPPTNTSFTRSPLKEKPGRTLASNTRVWEDDDLAGEFGQPSQGDRYELPPRFMTPPRESLSEQLQQALLHHQHHYGLTVTTGQSILASHGHERQCLIDEACPICLRSEVQSEELMIVIRCKLLACNHVAHANCFKDGFQTISQHPFAFFKVNPSCMPPDQTRFIRGPRTGCVISLGLFHILSEVQFGHFKVENLGSTYDPKAEQDCLNIAPLAETSTGQRPLFSLRRGRLVVECQSPTTAERWRLQANYDLTGHSSCVDLVFMDTDSKVSVQLSIDFNSTGSWAIERLTIDLPAPPLTKRTASPKVPSSSRLSGGSGTSPLQKYNTLAPPGSQQQQVPALSSTNPSLIPPQPSGLSAAQAAQALKVSQRLLPQAGVDGAKHPPKHFKFPTATSPNSAATIITGMDPPPMPTSPTSGGIPGGPKPKIWDLPPNFASFEDHIPSLATTQLGSRFLQRKVEEGNPEFLAMLFEQLLDFLPALIVDLFGNYLCQSMVCHATDEQRYRLLVKIKPHLVPVACARQGTRMVQKLVELSTSVRDRKLILEALTGAVTGDESNTSTPTNHLTPRENGIGTHAPESSTPRTSATPAAAAAAPVSDSKDEPGPGTPSAGSAPAVEKPSVTPRSHEESTKESEKAATPPPDTNARLSTSTNTPPAVTPTSMDGLSTAPSPITATTQRVPEDEDEFPPWQVTDKTSLLTLMKGSSGAHVIHAILDHWPVGLCRPIIHFAFEMSSELGVHQHGLCVLKKCLTVCTPEDLNMFVSRIQPQIFTFINDPYGNYLIQHLLERCDAPETNPEAMAVCSKINWDLHRSLQGHYPWLSRQKFSSNVVEKCLRTPDLKLRSSIIEELTKENTISQLLQCSFGNYVMQHVLEVASPSQAAQVITRIQPDLRLLRKNIRKKWERLLLRYDADAPATLRDQAKSPSSSSETSSSAPPTPLPLAAPATSPAGSGPSPVSSELNSQLLAYNRNLANEFRAFQALQDSVHATGEYNEHKTGSGSRPKPRGKTAVPRVPGKEFVPESPQQASTSAAPTPGATAANDARYRGYPYAVDPSFVANYSGYVQQPAAPFVPFNVPRTFTQPANFVQQQPFMSRDQPRFNAAANFRSQ